MTPFQTKRLNELELDFHPTQSGFTGFDVLTSLGSEAHLLLDSPDDVSKQHPALVLATIFDDLSSAVTRGETQEKQEVDSGVCSYLW